MEQNRFLKKWISMIKELKIDGADILEPWEFKQFQNKAKPIFY